MMEPFKLGDKVWRVQESGKEGLHAYGPAIVTAVVERASGLTYLLAWSVGDEIEQDPARIFLSQEEAQDAADREHNARLERKMRPLASD